MLDVHPFPSSDAWFVIRTHPRQEFRAEQNLVKGGIEVFLPRVLGRKSSVRPAEAAALFPQYLFARFNPEVRLHDVIFTRGVQAPLRIGARLAVVDDAVVGLLRARMSADGLIRVQPTLQPGEKVLIEDGPLAAFVAIVERAMTGRERVVLLLTAVQTPLRVQLDVNSVRRLSRAETET